MTVTRNQLARGSADYVLNEVAPNIPDMGMRFAATMFANSLKNNPALLDKALASPAMTMLVIPGEQGTLDVEPALNAIGDTLKQYGQLTLTIPSIPLISKGEKTLSFTASDIEKLRSYIDRSERQ